MEFNISPFVRLKIYVINGNSELVLNGMDKLIIVFNKMEITNYSQFVEKLNEIYSDYGLVDKITDKEGFKIMEFNNLPINNIWNYLSNDDIIHISLIDNINEIIAKNKESNINIDKVKNIYVNSNLDNRKSSSYNINYSNPKKIQEKSNNYSLYNKKNYISNQINKKNESSSISSSSGILKKKNNTQKNLSSSSSSSSLSSPKKSNKKSLSSSSSLSSSNSKIKNNKTNKNRQKIKSSSSSFISISDSKYNNKNNKKSFENKNNLNDSKISNKNSKIEENDIQLLGKKTKKANFSGNNSSFKNKKKFYDKDNNKKYRNNFKKTKYILNKEVNNNNINDDKNKNINYELIPSDKLDDITFLQNSYPKLFIQGTKIKFKIQELLQNGIGIGNYHYGIIENYNSENKSFLVKNCNSLNEKTMLFMYQYDEDLMCVELKNFVEIWIENENNNNKVENKENYNVDITEDLKKHLIKRQIEYYFSDDNYEKDTFLKSKEDENGYIPIDVIMSFNKIKMITSDKDLFVKTLKEFEKNFYTGFDLKYQLYELNEDLSKIRKRKLSNN